MLDTLPSLPQASLPGFLLTLTPLCTSHPSLFTQHLPALLSFLPALILPSADPGPTPTVARPFPGAQGGSFTFPPEKHADGEDGKAGINGEEEQDEEKDEVRKAALEFMISLSEAKPGMVKRVDGWVPAIVRGCLEGMGELREDDLDVWLEADVRSISFNHTSLSTALISDSRRRVLVWCVARRRPHGRIVPACIRTIP